MDYYNILVSLAELASKNTNNKYGITDYALGYIPFKNGKNKVQEVGNNFIDIAQWLLNEIKG